MGAAKACAFLAFATAGAAKVPAWNWDTIQTYVHCANRTGPLWNDAALASMGRSAFVVFEKNHGLFAHPKYTGAEEKIAAACSQVKDVPCLMYTESDLARTYYDLGVKFDAAPDLEVECADGATLANSTWHEKPNPLNASEAPSGVFHVYDFARGEARTMWVDRVASMVASKEIDGAFIDGNRNAWGSSAVNCASADHKRAWSEGLNASHAALRDRVGGATLISNYPTGDALKYATGGMIERFTPNAHVQQLMDLSAAGFLVAVHAQYATEPHLSKHLAAFLVGAGNRSYFGAGQGWDGDGDGACATWLKRWDEFDRPLGAPDGPAAVVAGKQPKAKWTRKFATGTHVLLDATPAKDSDTRACIWWSDGTITAGAKGDCNGTDLLAGTPLAAHHAAWAAAFPKAAASPFAPRQVPRP